MSESQERMCAVVAPDKLDAFMAVCRKWDVEAVVIGEVNDSGRLTIEWHGDQIVDVPPKTVAHDGPVYERPYARPTWQDALQADAPTSLPRPSSGVELRETVAAAAGQPEPRVEVVGHRPVRPLRARATRCLAQPEDSGIVRINDDGLGVAVSTDGNGRYGKLDPYAGAQLALAEAYRNVATTGAKPLAVTNCLNFGSPEDTDVMWQFAETTRGLADACLQLGVPVTGGNVSFYNQTGETAILPTPVIGVLGVIDDVARRTPMAWDADGDAIWLVGETADEFGGSEWAHLQGHLGGLPPKVDLDRERQVAEIAVAASRDGLLTAAHDVSVGGLAITLVEMALRAGKGCAQSSCPTTSIPSSLCSRSLPVGSSSSSRVVKRSGSPTCARRVGSRQRGSASSTQRSAVSRCRVSSPCRSTSCARRAKARSRSLRLVAGIDGDKVAAAYLDQWALTREWCDGIDDWSAPSAIDGWTLRDLVAHFGLVADSIRAAADRRHGRAAAAPRRLHRDVCRGGRRNRRADSRGRIRGRLPVRSGRDGGTGGAGDGGHLGEPSGRSAAWSDSLGRLSSDALHRADRAQRRPHTLGDRRRTTGVTPVSAGLDPRARPTSWDGGLRAAASRFGCRPSPRCSASRVHVTPGGRRQPWSRWTRSPSAVSRRAASRGSRRSQPAASGRPVFAPISRHTSPSSEGAVSPPSRLPGLSIHPSVHN